MIQQLKKYLLLLMAVLWSVISWSQVNVSLTLRPPYSSNLKDYYHLENKAIIVLTNTSANALEVKLGGSIVNEQRGLYVRTKPEWQPPMPISLAPFGTVTLTANPDAMRFFDQANATTNANDEMLQAVIRTGKLPEGTYTICVDAYDYRTGKQLSQRSMSCFSFELSWLDPPVITFPQNDYIYPATQAAKNFSWTPPLGNLAGGLIEYEHIVVKVQPGQNPNDAIAAARDFDAANPVLKKKNLLTQSYITQPFDLPFEENNLYAMQVIARDRNGKLLLKNDGQSQIVTFRIGSSGTNIPKQDYFQNNDIPDFYGSKTVTGNIKYYWPVAGSNGQSSGGISAHNDFSGFQQGPMKNVRVKLVLGWRVQNVESGSGSGFLLPGGIVPPTFTQVSPGNVDAATPENVPTLATATTDNSGNFSFNVINAEAINFNAFHGSIDVYNAGCFGNPLETNTSPVSLPCRFTGTLSRVLLIVVDDVYYCQPIQYKTGFNQSNDLGTFYSRVKTITARVKVWDEDDHTVKSGIEVFFMRKSGHRPATVPSDEMSPGNFSAKTTKTIRGQVYEVLARKNANSSGIAVFENAVFFNYYGPYTPNQNNYDRYYVYASDANSNFSLKEYDPAAVPFDFEGAYDPNNSELIEFGRVQDKANYSIEGGGLANNQFRYQAPDPLFTLINTEKDAPRIEGIVRNVAAGVGNSTLNRAEEDVQYKIYRISKSGMLMAKNITNNWGAYFVSHGEGAFTFLKDFLGDQKMKLETSGYTGSDGKIAARGLRCEWDGPQQVGYYRFVQIKKPGFGTRYFTAKRMMGGENSEGGDMMYIAKGETYRMNELEIKPLGSLFVKLINEKGEPVEGSAYYTDLATGQNGVVKSGMYLQGQGDERSYVIPDMNVPTGSIHIVVQPYQTNYYVRDTFLVTVPEGTMKQVTLKLSYKLHRIHLNVKKITGGALQGAKVELMHMSEGSVVMFNDLHAPGSNNILNTHQNGAATNGNDIISSISNIDDAYPSGNLLVQGSNNSSGPLGPYAKLTNSNGDVDFVFRNASSQFEFRFTGPEGIANYVVIEKEFSNAAGKQWAYHTVELKSGRKVEGTVKIGSAPVANATVQIINVYPVVEVYTNAEGHYQMNGVPKDVKLRFSASKQGYQGMEFDEAKDNNTGSAYGLVDYHTSETGVNVPGQSGLQTLTITTLDFRLRIYKNLDLSRLLGFPLEVTSLTEIPSSSIPSKGAAGNNQQGGKNTANNVAVEISGLISISDSLNSLFKLDEISTLGNNLNKIRFERKLVVADDLLNDSLKPYCRPQTLPFRTIVNEQHITVYDFYNATMEDPAGIALTKSGEGAGSQGVAQAKVIIGLSSFTDNNIGLADGQDFYLSYRNGNTANTTYPVFTSTGRAIAHEQDGIGLSSSGGDDIAYTLHGFDAKAKAFTSRIFRDSMILDTRLQTNILYVDNPNMDIPIGSVKINSNRELADIDNPISHTTTMGSFNINWNRIRLSSAQGGVKLNGTLHAAGMSLPFSNAQLYPTQFQIADGSLDVGNVKLLDAIDMQVNAPASFGYETGRAAWALAVYEAGRSFQNPSAAFKTDRLQGFPANKNIPVASIYMYSDDSREINLYNEGNYTFRLYDIADFYIDNILPADNILKMPGTLNLGIPNFPNYTSAVQYDKTTTGISGLSFQQFLMNPITVNGIVLGFDPGDNVNQGNNSAITITQGKIIIKGSVSDENPDVFNNIRTTITKTNQLTELVIDEPEGARQHMALGGANTGSRMILSEIAGKMWVINNQWNHLYVEGDMPEEMGFTADGKRMRFEVQGALSANNQQVKLKNVSTPFGNINLMYDMANHRLSGGLQVEANAGGAAFSGAVSMVIDRSGYYFMSGVNAFLSSPKMQGMAFLLVGDYSRRTQEMDALLASYSMYIQKKLEIISPPMSDAVLNMLSQNPEQGLSMVQMLLGNNFLPEAYTRLFNGGPFNGFYFNAGADIPIPIIPSFEIDLEPVARFGMSVNMGADIRFGANFAAQNSYSVGFNVFLDASFGGGANAGLFCIYGRIGAMVGFGMDGYFNSGVDYYVGYNGEILLSGMLRAGALACTNAACDNLTCVNAEISGSINCGIRGSFSNTTQDFELFLREGGNSLGEKSVHEPPPAEGGN